MYNNHLQHVPSYAIITGNIKGMIMSVHHVLVQRYLQLLNEIRPDVIAKKNKEGSLELSHAKWMLEKMCDDNFLNKTSNDAWITWIQASLYCNGILEIRNEIAITRDIMRQDNLKRGQNEL